MSQALERAAAGCLLAGFPGTSAPGWVLGSLADGLGGAVLFAWNCESPEQVAALAQELRADRPDAVVAIDEEGGDVTRLEAARGSSYPSAWALGAVDDPELTRRVAASLGADLVAAGITLDLAPVADVNTNPANPVIGIRSFGADPALAARHVAAFVTGLQETGVAACAKHFPGHGDTELDSHLALPVVGADRETLLARELVPFRAAVDAGVRAVMTAHVVVPALDGVPATVSATLLGGLLRGELGFEGAIVTDALEMRAVAGTIGVEETAVRALAAGADALITGHDLGASELDRIRAAIVAAVRDGRLDEERVAAAAARTRALGAAPAAAADGDRAVGPEAARRALRWQGDLVLGAEPLVVDLRPEPTQAAGPAAYGLAEHLAARLPGVGAVRAETPAAVPRADGRPLVVVVRDAHRHAWVREAVERLVAAAPEAVVVETGIPEWRPPAPWLVTNGAARVSLEAAAERLVAAYRRT